MLLAARVPVPPPRILLAWSSSRVRAYPGAERPQEGVIQAVQSRRPRSVSIDDAGSAPDAARHGGQPRACGGQTARHDQDNRADRSRCENQPLCRTPTRTQSVAPFASWRLPLACSRSTSSLRNCLGFRPRLVSLKAQVLVENRPSCSMPPVSACEDAEDPAAALSSTPVGAGLRRACAVPRPAKACSGGGPSLRECG